ncbi:hypothetical protein HBB16_19585 [Pseudonocardia sp. MCCB 268]|nr:hypothetical protein [Pseudonocardia cytotoxica]
MYPIRSGGEPGRSCVRQPRYGGREQRQLVNAVAALTGEHALVAPAAPSAEIGRRPRRRSPPH